MRSSDRDSSSDSSWSSSTDNSKKPSTVRKRITWKAARRAARKALISSKKGNSKNKNMPVIAVERDDNPTKQDPSEAKSEK